MTLNGAIMQLVEMRESSMMPIFFKPCFDKVIETISECEEPHSQPQWILCSERLPKTEVLCCDKYGEMIIAYVYADDTSDTGFSAESETQCMYNCVAWQPLPEPYKEGNDEIN